MYPYQISGDRVSTWPLTTAVTVVDEIHVDRSMYALDRPPFSSLANTYPPARRLFPVSVTV
jgi:hypothetical protein